MEKGAQAPDPEHAAYFSYFEHYARMRPLQTMDPAVYVEDLWVDFVEHLGRIMAATMLFGVTLCLELNPRFAATQPLKQRWFMEYIARKRAART